MLKVLEIPDVSQLSLEEKVGQLIVTRTVAKNVEKNIEAGLVGGVCCMSNSSADRIAELQEYAAIPLMTAMDLENGGFSGSSKWPMAMCLGATNDEGLAYDWAAMQAREARNIGVNTVFGPVLDVSFNPEGECLGVRSIGDDIEQVSRIASAMVRGYQDNGLQTFAKHLPGFGRHRSDAHIELARIDVTPDIIIKEDLFPYRFVIKNAGLRGIMTGHVIVPTVDSEHPSPVSKKVVGGLMNAIGFDGIAITDSLAMKGIKTLYPIDELYVKSFEAGHDLILTDYELDDVQGHKFLLEAVKSGRISMQQLDNSVQKILDMKRWICKTERKFDIEGHQSRFNEISKRAITAITNGYEFQPVVDSERLMFVVFWSDDYTHNAEFSSSSGATKDFIRTLKLDYPKAEVIVLPEYPGWRDIERTLLQSFDFDRVVPVVHTKVQCYRGTDHLSRPAASLIRGMSNRIKTLISLGNPYAIRGLPKFEQLVFAYSGGMGTEALTDVLAGRIKPKGKLPVNIWKKSHEL